jgi:hypothetical protein
MQTAMAMAVAGGWRLPEAAEAGMAVRVALVAPSATPAAVTIVALVTAALATVVERGFSTAGVGVGVEGRVFRCVYLLACWCVCLFV